MRRHLWVIEWRDPDDPRYGTAKNKRWQCPSSSFDVFYTKREALDMAREDNKRSNLEFRVAKYVPYKRQYIGY